MKLAILLLCALLALSCCHDQVTAPASPWNGEWSGQWRGSWRGWGPIEPVLSGDSTYPCMADNYTDKASPTENNGGNPDLLVGYASGNETQNALLYFDYSDLFGGPTVTLALCSLYAIIGPDTLAIASMDTAGNWVEGTATEAYQYGSSSWNLRGFGEGVTGGMIAIKDSATYWYQDPHTYPRAALDTAVAVADHWVVFDVTAQVQSDVLAAETYGFVVYDLTFNAGAVVLASSEAAAAYRSRLYIEWSY